MIGYAIIALALAYFLGMKLLCDWLERHYWRR
jgi:hypothetical protein